MDTKTALLVMDMQQGILANLTAAGEVISKTALAIEKARKNSIPVLYVTVAFREGFPEISDDNKIFAGIKMRTAGVDLKAYSTVVEKLTPQPGEITICKRRISAFAGSDLEVVLRAKNIRHLVLTGVSTSGVVLSTLREAADKDFKLTVLADACADHDAEVHRVLTEKVFTRQADVVSVSEWPV